MRAREKEIQMEMQVHNAQAETEVRDDEGTLSYLQACGCVCVYSMQCVRVGV